MSESTAPDLTETEAAIVDHFGIQEQEASVALAVATLEANGYEHIPAAGRIVVGARVRHSGERWDEAMLDGTAIVRAVLEKRGSRWAHSYSRPDIEIVVERDKARFGPNRVSEWADYHTVVIS